MATRQREKYCLINSSPLYRCAETVKTMWDDINTIDGEDTLHGLIMATREIAQGEASHLPLDWTNDKPLLNAIGFEGTQDPLKNGGLFEVPADGPQRGTWAADTIGNIIGAHSSITESDGEQILSSIKSDTMLRDVCAYASTCSKAGMHMLTLIRECLPFPFSRRDITRHLQHFHGLRRLHTRESWLDWRQRFLQRTNEGIQGNFGNRRRLRSARVLQQDCES